MTEAANLHSPDDICFVTPEGMLVSAVASARSVPSAAVMALEIAETALTLGDLAISAGHAEKAQLLADDMRGTAAKFQEAAGDVNRIGPLGLLFSLCALVDQLTEISSLVLPPDSEAMSRSIVAAHETFDAQYFNLLADARHCLHHLENETDIAARDVRAFILANLMLDLVGWLLSMRASSGVCSRRTHPISPPQPVTPFLRKLAPAAHDLAADRHSDALPS